MTISHSSGWATRAKLGKRFATLLADLLAGADRTNVVRRLRRLADELEADAPVVIRGGDNIALASDLVAYWKKAVGKPKARTTAGRVQKVRARLDEGYSAEDIRRAIDGCATTPFNMGENDSAKEYNDITLICRNGEKLEAFRDAAPAPVSDRYSAMPEDVIMRIREFEREANEALSEGRTDDYNAANTALGELIGAHSVEQTGS